MTGRVLTPEEQARKTHEECEMHAGPLYHDWTYHLPTPGRVQPPHGLRDCEVRCRSCGAPMDDCPTEGPPWCCDRCHHCVLCADHKEACHAV